MCSPFRNASRLFVFIFCAAGWLAAQTFTARIAGAITDSSGAPVPAARITVHHVETNTDKQTGTGTNGVYDMPLLLPGSYSVKVEATGLATALRRDVKLEVNAAITLDFTLKVAAVATVVDVTAEVPMLQTESSGVGSTIETSMLQDFPLQERDVMGMVRAIPGVITNPTVGQARSSRNVFDSEFSVGGGRSSMNEVLLDGSSNTIGDFNGVVVVPTQDSVEQFRVETSSYSAEFGRSGGGTVNIVTKAGTNEYHGTAYYYHQNDDLNANSFVNNRNNTVRPFLRRHQYGYSLGGPVWIPKLYNGTSKTFFFTTYEGRRESNPDASLASLPTAAQIAGDFSKTMALSGSQYQLIQIYDPTTSTIVNGTPTRQPFPGNVIPQNRLNPIALNVLKYYPAPNRAGSSITGLFNYQFNATESYSHDVVSGRIDQYMGDKHRVFFRFNLQENLDKTPTKYVEFVNTDSTWDHFKNFALDDTYQLTAHLNNVFRYSYTRFRANLTSNSQGFDPATLGLPNYYRDSSNTLFFPNFSIIGGPFPSIGGTAYNNQPRDTQGVQDNVVYTRGRHNLKAGAEYRLLRFYPFQVFNPTGGFSFSAAYTQSNQIGATNPLQGYGLASLLLGNGSFSFDHAEALSAYHHYLGSYIQDDWKVTSRLTLNLGVRWEAETGTGESHNRLSYFDPSATNPAGGKGAMEFTGNGNPSTIRATNWTNFGPRVGFAYRPRNKWVVRGGYGIFFLPIGLEPTLTTTPYNYTLTADNLNTDYTPRVTLSNPFPAGLPRPGSAVPITNGSYQLGLNASIVLRDQPAEYNQEWNMAVSRQLAKSTTLTTTYNGSRGVHLPIPSMELNQIDPRNLANGGSYLTQLVANPYYGKFSSGLLAQANIPQEQLMKPYPTFASTSTANAFGTSLTYYRPPVGDSVYHAVTVQLERRFGQGLSVEAHYTLSKLIDVGGVGNGAAFTDPSALRDNYNMRLERSLGSFDVHHRAIVLYTIDLPFGRNKLFGKSLAKGPKWADRVLSGWQLVGIHTLQSGLPVAIGGSDLSRLAGANPTRATIVPGQVDHYDYSTEIAHARAYNPNCGCTLPWINTAAFMATPQYQIPNGPRFLPDVRAGFLRSWDLTLTKNIRINERMRFGLQAKGYNVLNQVTFAGPSVTTVGSTNFGSAGGVNSNPRTMEVGGKLYF